MYYNWYLTNFHVAVATRLSEDIYKYYISSPYEKFSKLDSSKFIYNCTEGVESFRNSLLNLTTFILEITLSFIICTFLFFLNAKIMLSVIVLLSIITLSYKLLFLRKNEAWGQNVKDGTRGRIFTLSQTFSSIKDINIFSGQSFFINQYSVDNLKIKKYQKYYLFFRSTPKLIFEFLIVSFLLLLIYFMMQNNIANNDEILIILSTIALAFFRLYPAAHRIVSSLQVGDYGISVLNDLGHISKKIKNFKIDNKDFYSNETIKIKNHIELKNICLARKDKNDLILKNINLNIVRGSIVGIKGDTGSGKSTLLDIITGFFVEITFSINGKWLFSNEAILKAGTLNLLKKSTDSSSKGVLKQIISFFLASLKISL